MGKFSAHMPDELYKQLYKLGAESERIAKIILDTAVEPLTRHIKAECRAHRRTGTMEDSVKKTKVGYSKTGAYYIVVRPTGVATEYIDKNGQRKPRKTPVRNMEIMAHAEYGTSNQDPTPILSKAIADATPECVEIMQETFNREVEKL